MRDECRKCGAKLKNDKTLDQYDPEYCSGKCRREDGAEPYVKSDAEKAAVIEVVQKQRPASLKDYEKNVPSRYARRFQAEKLNWSANEMNEEELEQAGFRANRKPIPGDWDYEAPVPDDIPETADIEPPLEWNALRSHAKDIGIETHGKKRDELEAEIEERENG